MLAWTPCSDDALNSPCILTHQSRLAANALQECHSYLKDPIQDHV